MFTVFAGATLLLNLRMHRPAEVVSADPLESVTLPSAPADKRPTDIQETYRLMMERFEKEVAHRIDQALADGAKSKELVSTFAREADAISGPDGPDLEKRLQALVASAKRVVREPLRVPPLAAEIEINNVFVEKLKTATLNARQAGESEYFETNVVPALEAFFEKERQRLGALGSDRQNPFPMLAAIESLGSRLRQTEAGSYREPPTSANPSAPTLESKKLPTEISELMAELYTIIRQDMGI